MMIWNGSMNKLIFSKRYDYKVKLVEEQRIKFQKEE